MAYLSRDAVIEAATHLLEKDLFLPHLGGQVRIRELTGMQRYQAQRAAAEASEDPDEPDNDIFRAHVVVMGTVEPELTVDDVDALKAGRYGALNTWAYEILALSEALPGSLKSRRTADDTRQRGAESSAGAAESDDG